MKTRLLLGTLCALNLATLLVLPWVGPRLLPVGEVFSGDAASTAATIFWQMRVPRVLTAYLAGTCLALSGVTFQAMFRNALAEPFTLGVASGASLGAVLAIRLGWTFTLLGLSSVSVAAFAGALGATLVVLGLTRLYSGVNTLHLLLAGVALNAFFSSVILFLNYTADFYDTFRLMRWLMGGISQAGYVPALQMLPFTLGGALVLGAMAFRLDLLSTGDDLAQSRGVAVARTHTVLFLTVSLLVGSVVSVCGPIGFAGLIVPHICRVLFGNSHVRLLPATLLAGGPFLVLCDTVARTAAAPAEIPVGVITALLGGPFFLALLLRSLHTQRL